MKLAEALQERADLNNRISQLRQRLTNNALVQEGEKTAENPEELLRQLNTCIKDLCRLIAEINLTNSVTKVKDKTLTGEKDITLTELIAQRDTLTLKVNAYREFVNEASSTTYRARGTEIKIMPSVNVQKIQKEIDQMSKQLRLIDNRIQETNWTTDLIQN
jgi:uncharacterized coiled-coil DUF342 family protein